MSTSTRSRFVTSATLGYAVLATVWIFFSDGMLSVLADPATITRLGTAKGLAFVALTSTLLWLALRHIPDAGATTEAPARPMAAHGRPWPLIVVFVILTATIAGITAVAYTTQSAALQHGAMERLEAIAKLKVYDISAWLHERKTNAETLSRNPVVGQLLNRWLAHGAESDRASLRALMRSVRENYGFANVELWDPAGRRLLHFGNGVPDPEHLRPSVAEAAGTGEIVFLDLHRHEADDYAHMSYFAPVLAGGGVVGVMLFDMRPTTQLYPLIRNWPLPSRSGEIVLSRREGNDVVFLSDLRDRPDSALTMRLPADDPRFLAPRIYRGETRIADGRDYRGVAVLAVALPVPGTPWTLVAKMDEDEALGAIKVLGRNTILLLLAAMAAAVAVIVMMWQRQRLQAALVEVSQARAIEAAETKFKATFEQAAVGLLHVSFDGRLLRSNGKVRQILGYAPSDTLPANILDVRHPDDSGQEFEAIRRLVAGEIATTRTEKRHFRKDGGIVWLAATTSIARDAEGRPSYLIVAVEDVSERVAADERLRQAATVFTSTHEGIVITDAQANLVTVNPAFTTITGYTEADLAGRNMRDLQSGKHGRDFYRELWHSVSSVGYWQGEIWNRRKNGEIYPEWLTISAVKDDHGQVVNYVGAFTDITRIKQSETQLEHLAHHDPLTDLPNRLLLRSRIDHAVARARRAGGHGAVMFLDLDRFKTVNESLGHATGDLVLRAVAGRLERHLRDIDTVARLGADEFAVLIEDIGSAQDAADVAQGLIDGLSEPFSIEGGRDIYVGASIGISLFPDDADDADRLIQNADSALHQAKAAGRGTSFFYTSLLTSAAHARLELEANLRRAFERDEFTLHYQPLVSLADGSLKGVEALLRWSGPAGGDARALVPPSLFIPVAEETGLIIPLGEWVLRTACARMAAWRAAAAAVDFVAVNLSPVQFQQPDLPDRVAAVLAETGLPAHCLELEITEGVLVEENGEGQARLAQLKRLGVRLAIDDFGTGYSSLGYLKRLPIDKVKIDKSFVHDLPDDDADAEIVTAVISLAHSLKLEVLAEGVETEDQLRFLRDHGCDSGQGFLFSKAVPPEEIAGAAARRLIAAERRSASA